MREARRLDVSSFLVQKSLLSLEPVYDDLLGQPINLSNSGVPLSIEVPLLLKKFDMFRFFLSAIVSVLAFLLRLKAAQGFESVYIHESSYNIA